MTKAPASAVVRVGTAAPISFLVYPSAILNGVASTQARLDLSFHALYYIEKVLASSFSGTDSPSSAAAAAAGLGVVVIDQTQGT